MHQTKRSACYREILGIDADRMADDGSRPRDNPVTGKLLLIHVEIAAPVFHKEIILMKGAGIQQRMNPVPCGQLPESHLALDRLVSASTENLVGSLVKIYMLVRWRQRLLLSSVPMPVALGKKLHNK
jgi:hypothetical protein